MSSNTILFGESLQSKYERLLVAETAGIVRRLAPVRFEHLLFQSFKVVQDSFYEHRDHALW